MLNLATALIATEKEARQFMTMWNGLSADKRTLIIKEDPTLVPLPDTPTDLFMMDAARQLPRAMRFEIDPVVLEAVSAMTKKADKAELCKAFAYARPPYPLTWMEWKFTSGDRLGFLIEGDKDHTQVRIRALGGLEGHPLGVAGHITVTGQGFTPHEIPGMHDTGAVINQRSIDFGENRISHDNIADKMTREEMRKGQENLASFAMGILLLLNSRSRVLKAGPEYDENKIKRVNKQRGAEGKDGLYPTRMIKFDTSRILDKTPGRTSAQAEELMAKTIVTGHFKVRKTGVFWWSPYQRRIHGDPEQPAMKDREMIRRDPGAPARTPDGEIQLLPGRPPAP